MSTGAKRKGRREVGRSSSCYDTLYKHFRERFMALVTELPLGAGESRFVSLYVTTGNYLTTVNRNKRGLQTVDVCCGRNGCHVKGLD